MNAYEVIRRDEVIEKVLVINFGRLGEMVSTTPIFKEIKRNISDCYLSFLTQPTYAEVFTKNPYIDELILFDKMSYRMQDTFKFCLRLRRKDIDLVIDLSKSASGAFISYMTGAPKRVGFKDKNFGLLAYHIRMKRDNSKYIVDSFLDTLKILGMDVVDLSLKLYTSEKDWTIVRNFLINIKIDWTKPLIILNPNVSIEIQGWSSEGFAEVGNTLIKNYSANIIIIQAPHKQHLISSITKRMHSAPIIASGFTIKQLVLLISKASLLITTDTGIKSLAVAMNVPSITIVGPTNYILSTPPDGRHIVVRKDLPCSPCNQIRCSNQRCMTSITPPEVLDKVKEILLLEQKPEGINYVSRNKSTL